MDKPLHLNCHKLATENSCGKFCMRTLRATSASCLALLVASLLISPVTGVAAQTPLKGCDATGIGTVTLTADGVQPSITSVSTGKAGNVDYCLVKVLVPKAINIWVGLPMGDAWNGRWQSVGGGVYAGAASVPTEALREGYAAATTDTGHSSNALSGSFGMLEPGKPNVELQKDFATRSLHLMAVVGKQLVKQFYGEAQKYSYWNGCSTGGRQGLRMAQDHPEDYDGILAGAPAIHWDRFQGAMLWYPMVQQRDNGGPVAGGDRNTMTGKYRLATEKAVAACDALDGMNDGLLTDPRACRYLASKDSSITLPSCAATDAKCLSPGEAKAIDAMWEGPVACAKGTDCKAPEVASRKLTGKGDKRLWYGQPRGTDLGSLGGATPFAVVTEQNRYWVYLDPAWDWRSVKPEGFAQYFRDNVEKVGPMMASDDPDLRYFRKRGGKLVVWHGWSDPLINGTGSVDYYNRVVKEMGGLKRTQEFARLYMAPGVGHCSGGPGHQPQRAFDAVVNWVEKGIAPDTLPASRTVQGTVQTRPLCPYPAVARWDGKGSVDDAASYSCAAPRN
jgi:pimeloyl-ACP methyl ester carboxylesterase